MNAVNMAALLREVRGREEEKLAVARRMVKELEEFLAAALREGGWGWPVRYNGWGSAGKPGWAERA